MRVSEVLASKKHKEIAEFLRLYNAAPADVQEQVLAEMHRAAAEREQKQGNAALSWAEVVS